MAKQVYDASSIQALKGLEPVRRMPGMYTHTVHPLHVVQEAIDNAIDEALAGFGKRITVRGFKEGCYQVEDEDRRWPVARKPQSEKSKAGRRTGTVVRLWPDAKYFDSPNVPLAELEHLVCSKAYLLPGLT